ncbi:MAG: hypothetical protein E2O36_03420 [Proteobacteria bacterium]|nr:MAG: hypothetical protein E2O35_10885 [Pseudomonadota bacterium]TDJ63342.1 MAG: hypothetical protein E2O36_03420 [Pseudomonadota bacterium]
MMDCLSASLWQAQRNSTLHNGIAQVQCRQRPL